MIRTRTAVAAVLILAAAVVAAAEDAEVFQAPKRGGFDVEGLLRHEWTRKIFVTPTETRDEDRWRGRLLPRLTLGGDKYNLVVGGDFNYSTDRNTDPKPGLLRDNYDSRSARLDLATLHLQPVGWLRAEGGRIVMPLGLTEMTWDKDLRPQGGALTLMTGPGTGVERLSVTGLYAVGSHVFDDVHTRLIAGGALARLKSGMNTHLELNGSYLRWDRLDDLEPMIRRQNTRDADGFIAEKFRIVDVVARVQVTGSAPMQLVGDMAWNTAVSVENRGLWLAAVLGSIKESRARLDYVYAQVDRNATVAAFATDDFFWATGWLGHKLELATRTRERISAHLIGQLQKFRDSPKVEERDHWVQRLRIELRLIP
jgi:hypothetical protein